MSKIIKHLVQENLVKLQEELDLLFKINEMVETDPRLLVAGNFWDSVSEIEQILFEMKLLIYPEDFE